MQNGCFSIYRANLIIIIRALISWVNPDPFNPIVRFLYRATEPVLRPIRRKLPTYQIGLDLSHGIGTLHLHGNLAPIRERRAMHLADRRGRDRHRVEVEEQPLERVPELLLDDAQIGRAHV